MRDPKNNQAGCFRAQGTEHELRQSLKTHESEMAEKADASDHCEERVLQERVRVTKRTEQSESVQESRFRLRPIVKERAGLSRISRHAATGAAVLLASSHLPTTFGHGPVPAQVSQLAIDLEGVVEKRQQQKLELVLLNERLADYVEKSRFLEAQNRRLALESETVRSGYNKEAVNIKARYLLEISEIKRLLQASETRRDELEEKAMYAEKQHHKATSTLTTLETNLANNGSVKERLYVQLGEMEGELQSLRRRIGDFDLERKRYSNMIVHLREEESEIRRDLEHERMASVMVKSVLQQLRDELEFISESHQSKMFEMAAFAYRDTTAENRAIWRSEFTEAFRSLHEDYMTRLDEVHMEVESSFAVTVQQQQTTSSKDTFELSHFAMESQRTSAQISFLNNLITDLALKIAQCESKFTKLTKEKRRITEDWSVSRARLETELETYRTELVNTKEEILIILDDKLSLEIEIASYKELLDSEEDRINSSLDVALVEEGRYNAKLAQRSMLESQLAGVASTGFGFSLDSLGGIGGGSSFSSSSYFIGGGAAKKISSSTHSSSKQTE